MAQADGPPLRWQSDVAHEQENGSRPVRDGAQDNVKLSDAWRHIKDVAREVSREADLYDLLASTNRSDTYQLQTPGWPSLLRPLSPIMAELPAMVLEQHASCQAMCFNGVFPQIGRAWASVDNALFLWRYDRSGDVPIKYSGEEQTICAVGLLKPRPGVFLAGVQHVLLVCTASEIVMLGVCTSGRQHEELSLQPLPLYTLPTDGVIMCCCAATASGRIFLGGADGHVYEVQYHTSDKWLQRRVAKVCVTGGLQRLILPSFIPSMLFGKPAAVDQLVVDDERHIMYALTSSSSGGGGVNSGQNNSIQVFDLGPTGQDAAKRVADVPDFYAAAKQSLFGLDVFNERKGSAVKYLTPIPTAESHKLQLLAVTADGRRVYFSVLPSTYGRAAQPLVDPSRQRPQVLQALITRVAVPPSGSAAGTVNPVDMCRPGSMEVSCALYARGCLLLAEGLGNDKHRTKLLAAARNLTLPTVSQHTGVSSAAGNLRELVTELDQHIAGEACAMAAVPMSELLPRELQQRMRDDLFSQVFNPPQRFVLLSNAGVIELEKRRPVDVLQQLLQEERPVGAGAAAGAAGAASTRVAEFFQSYGAAEAAAMCILLASAPPGAVPARVVDEALRALENPALVGEPQMPEDIALGGAPQEGLAQQQQQQQLPLPGPARPAGPGGMYMGTPVITHPEPYWSGAHHGLCLHVSRLLHPVWEQLLLAQSKGAAGSMSCRVPLEALQVLESKLRQLEDFLRKYTQRLKVRGQARARADVRPLGFGALHDNNSLDGAPAAKRLRMTEAYTAEVQRTLGVCSLVAKAAEALVLLQTLATSNFGRLVSKLDDSTRRSLRELTLRELAFGPDAQKVASTLVTMLVEEAQGGSAAVADDLTAHLQSRCPSYFKESSRLFYKAMAKLKAAEEAEAPAQRDAAAREAVQLLLRVASECQLEYVVSRLANLQQWEGIVDISLRAAAEVDPGEAAMKPPGTSETAAEAAAARRQATYSQLLEVLRGLLQPANGQPAQQQLSVGERQRAQRTILQRGAQSTDKFFHTVLYNTLVDVGATSELLALDADDLDGFLAREGGMGGNARAADRITPLSRRQVQLLELLARRHINARRYEAAADIHELLALRQSGDSEDMAVSLTQRVQHLSDALLQARSSGNAVLTERLRSSVTVMDIQARIAERLKLQKLQAQAAGNSALAELLSGKLQEVEQQVLDISFLYNSYANDHQMWDLCLEICHFSGQVEPFICKQLWDLLLKQQAEAARPATPTQRLQDMAAQLEALGPRFFPNTSTFPAPCLTLRLEQAAAGLWPKPSDKPEPSEVVVRSLLRACKGSVPAVQRAYEALLGRKAQGILEEDMPSPALRAQLLRSLLSLCHLVAGGAEANVGEEGAGALSFGSSRRAMRALADACDRYIHDSRLLGTPEGEQLAAAFEASKRELAV